MLEHLSAHVLDEWFGNEVKPRIAGRCTLVRFADDSALVGCQSPGQGSNLSSGNTRGEART
jgi:hypothetical protein